MVEIVTDYIKRIFFFRARKEYQFFIDFDVLVKDNELCPNIFKRNFI